MSVETHELHDVVKGDPDWDDHGGGDDDDDDGRARDEEHGGLHSRSTESHVRPPSVSDDSRSSGVATAT